MIELRGVHLERADGAGGRAVLDGVNLEVGDGEVVVITGPTGSGKSTLLSLLYGAAVAAAGQVRLFGHDVRRLRRSSIALLRRRVGVVPQDLRLLPDRSAVANVALALEVRGERPRAARLRAAEMLSRVGLADAVDRPVELLSQGEAQRVALARAAVGEPALLLLDEPTAHQDDAGRELVVELLSRGHGIAVSTDPELLAAARMRAWRVLELAAGKLVSLDPAPMQLPLTSEDAAAIAGELDAGPDLDEVEITIVDDQSEAEIVPFPRRSVL